MKLLEIKCSLREALGKKDSNRLRKRGYVPCVLYGGGDNIHFHAAENDFRHLVYTHNVYILKLDIGGEVYDAVLQEIQFHPVTDRILHMDFFRVFSDKPVSIDIPVQLNGIPEGVKQGGKLALEARRLKARALPDELPDILEVDVTGLGLGKSVKVGDMDFPGIDLLDSPNLVIASVKLTRAARGVAAGSKEGEEGEAGEEPGSGEEGAEAGEAPAGGPGGEAPQES